jgi:hypothetical protein
MDNFTSSYSFSCASCSKELRFVYAGCNWITCSQCGVLMERDDLQKTFSNELPGEDASFIQPGTLGAWGKNKFEVTGRIQFSFEDDSYVNWWHLDSAGKSLWLAESYGSMRIMKEDKLPVSVTTIEKMVPGDKVRMGEKEINFELESFSMALTWKTEGELPYKPEEKKFMWIELTANDRLGFDIHIFDRANVKAYSGEDVDLEKISLTKIRKVNGWN